jgi:hypothetical protein
MNGFAPTFCGLEYGRDVVSRACPRINPWASIVVMDNDWFAFLSQQAGIGEVNFLSVFLSNPPQSLVVTQFPRTRTVGLGSRPTMNIMLMRFFGYSWVHKIRLVNT